MRSVRVWSVIATYSWPRRIAACAISSIVPVPSLQTVCTWRSPRSARVHSGLAASVARASLSVRKSRRSGGGSGTSASASSQSRIRRAMYGPTRRRFVSRSPSTSVAASSGQDSAAREARRSARRT